jgi:hypothetical protein
MKHYINESLKRLEPVDKACQYCSGQGKSENMDENFFVPVFKEEDRTNIVVYRSVKFKKIMIGIPRCPSCLEIHDGAGNKAKLWSWVGAIIVFILFCLMGGGGGFVAVGLISFIIIGILGSYMLEKQFVRDRGILTKVDGAKENETVQEFIIQGWSFTQPSA